MQISKNMVVAVHYHLEVDGQKIDASGESPLTYLHGHGMMIKGFEKQLEGLKQGDKYDFKVPPGEGYGEYNKEAVAQLDKSIFMLDGVISDQVFEGAQLQLTNQEGMPMVGVVQAIGEETVSMDFNHQLAGKELHFTGNIETLREATEEEISHGHVHGPGGHQH